MKIHRPLFHVVLSLLLLISQQLGLAHVMTHMDFSHQAPMVNVAQGAANASDGLKAENKSSQVLLDLNCDQCNAFTQLANALPVAVPSLLPVLPASFIAGVNKDHSIYSQTQCVYLSRAPPVPA